MENIKFKFLLIFLILVTQITFSHEKLVHKYITWQAWQLVKFYHPEVCNSLMDNHFGFWNDDNLFYLPNFYINLSLSF